MYFDSLTDAKEWSSNMRDGGGSCGSKCYVRAVKVTQEFLDELDALPEY
jgi:hypothetical protein